MPLVFVSVEQNYQKGYDHLRSLIDLSRKTGGENQLGFALHSFGLFAQHWRDPLRTIVTTSKEAFDCFLSCGNLQLAGYEYFSQLTSSFDAGEPLERTLEISEEAFLFLHKTLNQHAWASLVIYRQLALCLKGETKSTYDFDTNEFSEVDHLDMISDNMMALCYYYIYKAQALYLFGRYDRAKILAEQAVDVLPSITTFYPNAIYNLYHSLSLCRLALNTQSDAEKTNLISSIEQNQQQMAIWAESNATNFQHKYDLVEAEKARVLEKLEAIEYYEKAIQGAKENEFPQEEALAYELASQFYFERGMELGARTYMIEAHNRYQQWGASAKVKDIEERYPQLLQTQVVAKEKSSDQVILDLNTVIKASQAIAGEIVLDRLLAQMMQIVIENAGAQKGSWFWRGGPMVHRSGRGYRPKRGTGAAVDQRGSA